MKRKDVLSKDEIINILTNRFSPLCSSHNMCCDETNCSECKYNYLNEEVETVPRYSLIKQDSDLDEFHEDWELYCSNTSRCDGCPYKPKNHDYEPYNISCFLNYLKEGVYSNEKI